MKTIRVLLCCGAGFSSGFLAQRGRQAAKKKQLDMTLEARSESVVSEYLDKTDIILVGPHYASALPKLREEGKPYGIKAELIPADIYSTLNGDALVELALRIAESGEEEA